MGERLQKIISRAGIASRREAEKMIREGRISVNNVIVTELGSKADIRSDEVRVDGRLIAAGTPDLYILLNKPRGYVTTMRDPEGRPIVTDLVRDISERLFPVGRLDYDSEGFLLLTNDGEFSYRIQHPKFEISKTYLVKVKGAVTGDAIGRVSAGLWIDGGLFKPSAVGIEKKNRKSCWLRIEISEGRHRIIRRVFESMGLPVVRLIRTAVGGLELGHLKPGEYRHLSEKEVKRLLDRGNIGDRRKIS
ncbi:MAG: rRNA pseudouridine synthase [Deltaproteobacteria bacterium]|nr:rRNA pseudouridine synthase [Deltaproteobacteria bacterium]